MVMYPSASCGSLAAPRPWPLSPVAAETCRARWDAEGSGGKRAFCIGWDRAQNSHQDLENGTRKNGDKERHKKLTNQRSHFPSPREPRGPLHPRPLPASAYT